MTWQERTRLRMKELKLAHGELAKHLNVKSPRLSQWLNGNRDPGIIYFAAIVTALDTSADWLLFGTENQMNWLDELDERQRKEIEFARMYAQQFGHGTDGHTRLLLLAKMADLLDAGYGKLVAVKPPPLSGEPVAPRKPAAFT